MLLCAAGASFVIMLDANIVAMSLPSIARDLHGEFTDVEWVVSAYILPFAALLMPAGALADRLGSRRILLWGLSIFTVASLLCGLAPDLTTLNGARALQAVGAALQLFAIFSTGVRTLNAPSVLAAPTAQGRHHLAHHVRGADARAGRSASEALGLQHGQTVQR